MRPRSIDVAFAETGAQPGQLTFAVDPQLSSALGGYTDADFQADFQADIATLRSRGKKAHLATLP